MFAYIGKQVATILGIKQMPDPDQGFLAMGIDSLLSIELKNRLEKGLEVSLPASLIFDFPNITRLVDYLVEQVFGWGVNAVVEAATIKQEVNEDLILQELADLEAFLGNY